MIVGATIKMKLSKIAGVTIKFIEVILFNPEK